MTTYDTQPLIPWQESIAYTRAKSAGDVPAGVVQAGVTQITTRDAARSNGVSLANDVTVEFGTDALTADPKPRDRVVWRGKTYTVISVGGDPEWLGFYSLQCRCPEIAYDLKDLADVLRPAPAPDAAGLRTANPATLASAVPCRLQPDGWAAEPDTTGRVTTRSRYVCTLGTALLLAAGDVVRVNGVKYEATEQSEISQLDTLTTCRVERIS